MKRFLISKLIKSCTTLYGEKYYNTTLIGNLKKNVCRPTDTEFFQIYFPKQHFVVVALCLCERVSQSLFQRKISLAPPQPFSIRSLRISNIVAISMFWNTACIHYFQNQPQLSRTCLQILGMTDLRFRTLYEKLTWLPHRFSSFTAPLSTTTKI